MNKQSSSIQKFLVLLIVSLSFGGLTSAQNTSLPYFNGFENPQDTAGWTFKKRSSASGFSIGSAVHCLGSNAMYISTDSGTTATFAPSASGYVSVVYRPFTLPAGNYTLAFDYQCGGNNSFQDMKVVWAPSNVLLNSSSTGAAYPTSISTNAFTSSDTVSTFGRSNWRHVTGTVTVPEGGGTYNLGFAFRSNSRTVVAPGACIDNIQLDTVKDSTDCTVAPFDIQTTTVPQVGIVATWNGNASEYEVIAAPVLNPLDYSFCQHRNITDSTDTIRFSEINDGLYFVYIRAVCGSDTSIYNVKENVIVCNPMNHCFDFTDFSAPGTQCTYGTFDNPYQNVGYINNGPSEISSRHTVNTELNHYDPITNNMLRTIPTGDMMSVRLGNWNVGSQGESVTYSYNITSTENSILLVKYAIVFDGGNAHIGSPEFIFEVLDENNNLIDQTCAHVYHSCGSLLPEGWNSCQTQTSSSTLPTTIFWKDWTPVGVNLAQYTGQTVKLRFTTKDCNQNGHFGYAYYTVDCLSSRLTAISSADSSSVVYAAPEGFSYQWINNCSQQTVSSSRTITVPETDNCVYTCICSNSDHSTCAFSLSTPTSLLFPLSSISYSNSYSDCQTHLHLISATSVYTTNNGFMSFLSYEPCDSLIWSISSPHQDRTYHNQTSRLWNFTIDIPDVGDTINVTLKSWKNGNEHEITRTIYIPKLKKYIDIQNLYICKGMPIKLNNKTYTFINRDSIKIEDEYGRISYVRDSVATLQLHTYSITGCDSIYEYCYRGLFADTINIDTVIRSGESYCLDVFDSNGYCLLRKCFNNAGHFNEIVQGTSTRCDSLYFSIDISVVQVGQHYVTVVANDNTMGTTQGSGPYYEGDIAVLTASPFEGYAFDQWNDGNTENPRSVVVTDDASYMAMFISATSLDDVSVDSNKVNVEKVFINGIFYVLRNGKLYTLTGIRVK